MLRPAHKPSHPAWHRDLEWTAAIFAIALAVRLAFVHHVPVGVAWDGVLYERAARAIARGLGYTTFMFVRRSSDTVATAYYPVGYPAFVGTLYALLGPSLGVLQVAGTIVSAASVAVAHRLAWRVAPGWGARLATLGLALMPGHVTFAGAAMTEPLFGLLLTLVTYATVRHPGPLRKRDLLLVALASAAGTYVRPQGLLLAAVLPALKPSVLGSGWRGRAAAMALTSAMTVACVLPWSVRNCHKLDGCAFVSTNGGANLAIGAVPRATGGYLVLDAHDGCAEVLGEVARDRCWRTVALRAIGRDPIRWVKLAAPKLEHTLWYETFPASYLRRSGARGFTEAHELALGRLLTASWRTLLVFALVALLPLRGRQRLPDAARVAIAASLVVLATHVLFFGGDRYHLPLVPLIAVVAAGALRGTKEQARV